MRNATSSSDVSRQATGPLRGFTIIELIVVMAVIGILAALSLPAITRARLAAKRIQCMNNVRNIALALTSFDVSQGRLPASGNWFDTDDELGPYHSWAVSILPWIDEQSLAGMWDMNKAITDPVNAPLTKSEVPVYVCPVDITTMGAGDQSYVVNGGIGSTRGLANGVKDCPTSADNTILDLNGNGVTCPPDPATDGNPSDRDYFKQMGLFFLENWNPGGTVRHYTLADIRDGLTQTLMVAENVRAGYNPADPTATFASPMPLLCAFYIGNPCQSGTCTAGNVDYSRCNAGLWQINSGLNRPEGSSPAPNSFHEGGVNMAFADGRAKFISHAINGAVYAALASPGGWRLQTTPLQQIIISDADY